MASTLKLLESFKTRLSCTETLLSIPIFPVCLKIELNSCIFDFKSIVIAEHRVLKRSPRNNIIFIGVCGSQISTRHIYEVDRQFARTNRQVYVANGAYLFNKQVEPMTNTAKKMFCRYIYHTEKVYYSTQKQHDVKNPFLRFVLRNSRTKKRSGIFKTSCS